MKVGPKSSLRPFLHQALHLMLALYMRKLVSIWEHGLR